MTTTEDPSTAVDTAPIPEELPVGGCDGQCEQLVMRGARAGGSDYHNRLVETIAGLDLAAVNWVLDQLALADDGELDHGVIPAAMCDFVGEHNWPDPPAVMAFARYFEWLYGLRTDLTRLEVVCRSAGIDVEAARNTRCVVRGEDVASQRVSVPWGSAKGGR